MFPVLCREGAKKHKVIAGDTLQSIATKYKLKEWQLLALHNWATDKAPEVNRAVFERIGCSKIDDANPELTVLAPYKNTAPEIEIPAPPPKLKSPLAVDKTYKITLKPVRPATAVSIAKLDRWFVPGIEDCTICYATEGLKECADKVALEVYGSGYCECTDWNKGLGKYSLLPAETPVFKLPPEKNKADERCTLPVEVDGPAGKTAWKGQADAAKGILSVKTGGKDRVINAAFSPYTVLVRYYKNADDAKAAFVLLPFWPAWKETPTEQTITGGNLTDEAAKVVVKWNNAAAAHWGTVVIKDSGGKVVWETGIPDGKLGAGDQQIEWNRRYQRGARNSRKLSSYLAADGPYTCEVTTVSGGAKTEQTPAGANVVDQRDKFEVEWDNDANFTSAQLDVSDRSGQKVYSAAVPGASGNQNEEWDGSYNVAGAVNSGGGREYAGADSGYTFKVTGKHEQAAAAAVTSSKVTLSWNNLIAMDAVRLEIKDKSGKLVVTVDLPAAKFAAGAQTYEWKKSYSVAGAVNSKGKTKYVSDDAPYTYRVIAEKAYIAKSKAVPGKVTIKWTNAAVAEQGLLLVSDKNGQVVHREDLAAHLAAAAQTVEWDKKYSGGAVNSQREPAYATADGAYVYKVVTVAGGAAKNTQNITGAGFIQTATVKIKWRNAGKVERGVIAVSDKNGQLVCTQAIPPDKLAAGDQEIVWDCAYRGDAWNSDFRQEYFAADGPYVYKAVTFVRESIPESLKAEWLVKNTDKLELGYISIVDGKDRVVFRVPLTKGQLAKSAGEAKADRRSFTWDGNYAPGVKNSKDGDAIIPEDTPYRVQVQGHTGMNKPEGLALAAMHTEVRLYVHPETTLPEDLRYDPGKAAGSLGLGLGPVVPGDPPGVGSVQWYQQKLAEYGFHPGPANGSKHAAYKLALKEFKRSVPKKKTGADFERLTIDDSESGSTKDAIESIRAGDKRGMFGDPAKVLANDDTPDLAEADIKAQLPDAGKEMIVWVDDRQYYTSGDPALDEAGTDFQKAPFNLGNPRGGMECGDNRPKLDADTIPRPWIPLQADVRLLRKSDELWTVAAEPDEVTAKAMRSAIGPLRVDWSFSELAPDLSQIDTTLDPYDSTFIRSRRYVAWAIDKEKTKHKRKDTKRDAWYTNAKDYGGGVGGIRPAAAADYFKSAFGSGDYRLQPWDSTPVADTETMATVVHDHLRGKQAENKDLYSKLIGTAGCYFTPSRVAADGYRVRAEVRLDAFTGYDFPNLANLKARYPVAPQVHTAALRIWRRSSFRGYMCWGPATAHWDNDFINAFRSLYRGAHVYFVHEGGARQNFPITDVFDPAKAAHAARFQQIISRNTPEPGLKAQATSLAAGYLWPWGNRNDLGYPYYSTAVNAGKFTDEIYTQTWRKFRHALLLALVKEVEKKGYLRGHLLVEFKDSPAAKAEAYDCDKPGPKHRFWFLWKATKADGHHDNVECPICGAPRKLTTQGHVPLPDGLGLPAVGGALGATWLFSDGAADRLKLVWVHEVGHHRHLQHAADGPGGAAELHDSEQNARFQAWHTVRCDAGDHPELAKGWDRRCIMSYSDCWYGEFGCLCGRCLLRNRGWKVTALGFPGRDIGDE